MIKNKKSFKIIWQLFEGGGAWQAIRGGKIYGCNPYFSLNKKKTKQMFSFQEYILQKNNIYLEFKVYHRTELN